MSLDLNKSILAGRLTAKPELKMTPTSIPVTSFTIAVNRPKPKDGGEQKADFINCVAWRQTAEFITRYFQKGSAICVIGSIQTRSWSDQNGGKRYATEVIVDEAKFVESKADSTPTSQGNTYIPEAYSTAAPKFEELAEDDELPF